MPEITINIAIANDAELIRSGFVGVIDTFGNCIVVLQASNGSKLISGLSLLERLPDICIIETDNRILNNYVTLIELQKRFPKIKVLALSGYKLEYTIVKMIQHGIRGYLLTKCTVNQLRVAIKHLHENEYYYSDIAPKELFEKAQKEVLPILTENELRLLSIASKRLSNKKMSTMSIEDSMMEDGYNLIIEKLKVKDRPGLATYMVQSGILQGKHFSLGH